MSDEGSEDEPGWSERETCLTKLMLEMRKYYASKCRPYIDARIHELKNTHYEEAQRLKKVIYEPISFEETIDDLIRNFRGRSAPIYSIESLIEGQKKRKKEGL